MKQRKNKPELPAYLEQQQNSSWQIEMLISGGFVLSLLQVPQWTESFYRSVFVSTEISPILTVLTLGLHMISRALVIGFAVNLLLRAIWLAMLGVNFTYPRGVNLDELNYSSTFKEKYSDRLDLVSRIIKMERLSSLAYSVTIMMTIGATMSIVLTLVLYAIYSVVLPQKIYYSVWIGFGTGLMMFLLSIGILDRLIFRHIKGMSKIYYPFHRLFNIVSLRWLIYPEWLTLISNAGRLKILTLFFGYFLAAIIITTAEAEDYLPLGGIEIDMTEDRKYLNVATTQYHGRYHYDDKMLTSDHVYRASISSDIIYGNYLPVFVLYEQTMDEYISHYADTFGLKSNWDGIKKYTDRYVQDSALSRLLNQQVKFSIDRQRLTHELMWSECKHHKTDERGFRTYVPLDSVSPGYHLFHVQTKTSFNEEFDGYNSYVIGIPFVKEE